MTLGERIKEQRKKNGLSQEKIAELVGTSRQAVTKWEAGQSIPCMENMIKLSGIFGISLKELSTGASGDILNGNNAELEKIKPLKPLLSKLTLWGYVLFAGAGIGYYESVLRNQGAPLIIWIILSVSGGICIVICNVKFHEQYGSLTPLIHDLAYIFAVMFISMISLPHGVAIRVMQGMTVLYIPFYSFKISPWRKVREPQIKQHAKEKS